jgi:hypothetical protein
MNRKQAQRLLDEIEQALSGQKKVTRLVELLNMDVEIYETMDDFTDAVTVRMANLQAIAHGTKPINDNTI